VEHACYQCGSEVEQGVAFCPQCRAPQIRVAVAEPAQAVPAENISPDSVHPALPAPASKTIDWRQALPAAVLAGFISAVLMITPLGTFFGLGMLASGFLCVLFYRRRVPHANPGPGMGARLGAVSGALSFILFGLFSLMGSMIFHADSKIRSALVEVFEQNAVRNPGPQAQQMLQLIKTPEGLIVVMVMGFTAMFLAFLIFSSLGGAIGAAMLRRKDRA
jgi:hypothetical protein